MTVFGKLQLSKQPEIHFRWAVISISVMWFQPLNMYTLLTPMLYITHTITIGLPFPACRYLSLHTIFISMVIAKHLDTLLCLLTSTGGWNQFCCFCFFPFFCLLAQFKGFSSQHEHTWSLSSTRLISSLFYPNSQIRLCYLCFLLGLFLFWW